MISDFKILPKLIYSDHCPCLLRTSYTTWPRSEMVLDCSIGFKSQLHYDVNRKLPKTIKANNMDLVAFGQTMEEKAEQLYNSYINMEPTQNNIGILCNELTEAIRRTGLSCYIRNHNHLPAPTQQNCTSENFAAIAAAHHSEYRRFFNNDGLCAEPFHIGANACTEQPSYGGTHS